jgi:hypothetical protein
LGIRYFMLRQVRPDASPSRLSLAMAGRTLVHFTLNVFVKGSGIEGKKIFKFIQKQRPLSSGASTALYPQIATICTVLWEGAT